MSAQRLDALPYDVKDIILSLVDSTKDLLHLGVSNKEWKALVIPHHIEYRVLRLKCHHSHPEVWNHLAQNRHLASRIRVVELEPDHVHADNADAHSTHSASKSPLCLYPKSLLGEPLVPRSGRADAKQDILHAFWNMTALTSFSWTTACCSGAGTFSSPLNADPTVIKEILNCLKGLQSLRKLSVCDSGGKVLACEDAREEHEAGHWLRGFHNIEELSASTRDPSLGVGIKSQEPMCNLRVSSSICSKPH
ncbi:hypothetical protein CC1G_01606 [Coprinopsis cinerea okayama7|uniref:F-box domain-containing protein n=1 Tax=Coprinopsis cinerea (strain Okayama-7 / 130 / ATCC MYA-4618 / FGSC 9003) TaxID=240176 RepID=A8NI78_COPC7|nr:hypothetical protein CC1G_01606 [Coprinopsis cinerea okayama7\|eukprot:XP_001833929.1 hypothetical protein CC1G_01606 [Coprinopsis cinerea okayama7\